MHYRFCSSEDTPSGMDHPAVRELDEKPAPTPDPLAKEIRTSR